MKNLYKIAAILAVLIGGISIVSGSKVLFGIDVKDYTVLNWLVIYNVIFGGISIVAAILIWKNNKSARKIILTILISHLLVFLYLYFINQEVALESIKAMGFRVSVWTAIFLLTFKKINH